MTGQSNDERIGVGERIYLHIYDYETKEFSGLTTFHGLVRIYSSNTWTSRIFWCVVVLSCLSLFMIHSGYLLLGYHSKPTLFQVNTIVAMDGISFPDITICNHNMVKSSRMRGYNVSRRLLSYILMSFNDHVDFGGNIKDHHFFAEFMENHTKQSGKNFSFIKFLDDIRPTCNDIVLACSFAGEPQDCCSISDVVMTDLGFCIRFSNSKLNKKQFLSGSKNGWQFVVDGNNELDFHSNSDMGFHVAVHEPGKEISMQARGLAVPPGSTLYAGYFLKNISLLRKAAWGLCLDDWDPLNHGNVLTKLKYTATHCEWNCLAREWLSTCGCVLVKHQALNISPHIPLCLPYDIQICADKVNESISGCNCDIECRLMEYEPHISYSDIIPSSLRQRFLIPELYIKDNISVINIFMRSIAYEQHEQQKQLQTADLLSSIAGSMGLFLGMSTITLLEIFIYLFKSVWGTVNTERQKQFMDAMMEEENERKQSIVIVEEPLPEALGTEMDPHTDNSTSHLRRVSITPLHIRLDRRGSNSTHHLHLRSNSSASFQTANPPRKSFTSEASERLGSRLQATTDALMLKFPSQRRSIAFGTIGRDFLLERDGDILQVRRGSAAATKQSQKDYRQLPLTGDSPHTPKAKESDDAIYHPSMNRRRSSVHPKHFLL